MKRILSLALVLMMTLALVPLPAMVAAEADDITGHKYETVMRKWIAKGWMAGTGAPGVFEPDKGVTRADFAVFFNHFANLTQESPDIGKYADVTGWQVLHMSRALQAGYYKGDGVNLMPGAPIPQEQALTSLKSQGRFPDAADLSTLDSLTNAGAVSGWARPFVAAAMAANFAMVADGALLAQDGLTRAETVFLLDSILTDTRTYGVAGEYADASVGGAVIAADGVTLTGTAIAGDLVIDEAVGGGDVWLDGVTVGGRLDVRGGGLNSVHVKGSKIAEVLVTKEGVRVVLESATEVTQLQVTGKGALVVVENGAKITNLNVGAAAEISGGGSVANATVTANGVVIAQTPTGIVKVEGENVTASIGGKTVHASGYGKWYRAELEQPEKGNLYGMCYLAHEGYGNGIDYKKAFQLMDNLGVQSIRHWLHFGYVMSDPSTFKERETARMHDILAEAARYDFQIIGMSHQNWSVAEKSFVKGKPARQTGTGSEYNEWLTAYEESWYNLVMEFPEITIWEIDNEINNKDFMYIQGKFGEKLPTEELAAMSADMLFYGSRGIHRANPDAVTVMGGIVDPIGLGIPETGTGTTMVNYMEALYDAIDSGEHGSYYYDDFFQVAAWHPYYYKGSPDEYFVRQNNAIYEVIRRREGKDKKVYLTEFGWNERHYDMDSMVSAIEKLYECVEREMPYVESLHYFRAFDNVADDMNTAGLFYDPNPNRTDIIPHTDRRGTPGAPKESAYAYQRAAGGNGSLELLMTPLE